MRRVASLLAAVAAATLSSAACSATPPVTAATSAQTTQLVDALAQADAIAPKLAKVKLALQTMSSAKAAPLARKQALQSGLRELDSIDQVLGGLRKSFVDAEPLSGVSGGADAVDRSRERIDRLRAAMQAKEQELEAGSPLDKFSIQELLMRFNQTQTLASTVSKKKEDTIRAMLRKIG